MYVLHLVQISIWTILLFKFSLCIFILHPENVNFVLEKYSPPQKKGKSKPKHCSVHKKHLKVFRHCCCSANTRQLAIPAFQPQVWSPSWKPEPFDRASGRLTAALLRELESKANKLLAQRPEVWFAETTPPPCGVWWHCSEIHVPIAWGRLKGQVNPQEKTSGTPA